MLHRLHLDIISQEEQLLSEDVDMVLVPSNMGQIGILPGHISLFASLDEGELVIVTESNHDVFAVTGGFIDVNQDKVTILANSAISAKNINIKKTEEAKKKAQETMRGNISDRDYKLAEADLRRAALELRVAKKRRHQHSPVSKMS
ncbi:MAG: ATP synthase F1 subunit epsilon [Candidatus Pacebacteria bacterium]|jgi:F-type H+-transporting ATPase subunit epsilon|nr:ATP synthase F1 subunit epsilon [Candidatus Paceibacterota bacterium]MBT3511709.1 ATP synthase F1 subunit epsilon [Candidatus Paceibacterota bacterium]MBT4005138.1 ATP synthase F1 subunit epsilon [Candidatus Paceibacterota bacterium]MBT4358595.1 ATP synthase F1 subunit epsilon [Candidatus Paceibacterota bacterium]MBT4680735.1 ATP synthase F1 subunit epsilon [Candidatus Paceibacterota bacterium]